MRVNYVQNWQSKGPLPPKIDAHSHLLLYQERVANSTRNLKSRISDVFALKQKFAK